MSPELYVWATELLDTSTEVLADRHRMPYVRAVRLKAIVADLICQCFSGK